MRLLLNKNGKNKQTCHTQWRNRNLIELRFHPVLHTRFEGTKLNQLLRGFVALNAHTARRQGDKSFIKSVYSKYTRHTRQQMFQYNCVRGGVEEGRHVSTIFPLNHTRQACARRTRDRRRRRIMHACTSETFYSLIGRVLSVRAVLTRCAEEVRSS